MIDQLAARVFQARNVAHKWHLKTRVYAQHMALGMFYDDVVEAIDTVVEVHQGRYGLITVPKIEDVEIEDVAKYLLNEGIWIETNRDKFSKCPAVLNRIDDLCAVYFHAAYRLTYLM